MTAVLTRRSEQLLTAPAPGDDEFRYLLKGAALAPDHGRLRPWRWVLARDAALASVADALAAEAPEDQREQVRRKALRAPLRAFLVFTPRLGHKVPEWEQLAAGSSVTHALMLLLHARGYGSIWRTGRLCSSMAVGELLGVAEGERLLGAVDIGTPARTAPPTRRPLPEISAHLSVLTPR
ncbi:nitroreductase family protein [Kitasatospora purpeofusca]|uniref:Putative NAD(P)H nitroreductase n=1 Tax=Kitasatospora purpeofusca TaxID=67352 RepID=A0ABZ1UEQ0_9ACTN|nr:nitroreductase family protein [Kitasatospora purpeofusca]